MSCRFPGRSPGALILIGLLAAGCSTTGGTARNVTGEEARLLALAQDIERRGDREMAASLYARAAQVSSDPVGAHVRLGEAQLAAGEPNRAADAFRTALQSDPNDVQALLGLGTAQLRSEQVESAARTLSAAAPLARTATAYNRLGTALVLSGDGAGAQAAFASARQIDPANLDTQSNLALAQSLTGNSAGAVSTLLAVVQSPRAEARHFRNLMLVLTLGGRDAEAAAVNVPDYAEADRRAFLAEARKVRAIASPAERARAIGLLAGR